MSLSYAPELTKESSWQSECYKYRHVSFWHNKLRCYIRHVRASLPSCGCSWQHHFPECQERERDGAGCLIMAESEQATCLENNAIISCVMSPGENRHPYFVCQESINRIMVASFFQEAVRFAREWKVEIRYFTVFINLQLSLSPRTSLLGRLIIWCIFLGWLEDQWSPFCSSVRHKSSH